MTSLNIEDPLKLVSSVNDESFVVERSLAIVSKLISSSLENDANAQKYCYLYLALH